MMQAVEAGRDYAALERFVPQFIERSAQNAESVLQRRRQELRAANPSRETDGAVAHGIPYAFELWIAHLGLLDQLSGAATFTLADLTAEEARGLAILRRARDKYWAEHSKCHKCGGVNRSGASFCGGCAEKFGGQGR